MVYHPQDTTLAFVPFKYAHAAACAPATHEVRRSSAGARALATYIPLHTYPPQPQSISTARAGRQARYILSMNKKQGGRREARHVSTMRAPEGSSDQDATPDTGGDVIVAPRPTIEGRRLHD